MHVLLGVANNIENFQDISCFNISQNGVDTQFFPKKPHNMI